MSFIGQDNQRLFPEKVEFLRKKYTTEDPVAIDKEWEALPEQPGIFKKSASITIETQAECMSACTQTKSTEQCEEECNLEARCKWCLNSVQDEGIGLYLLPGHDAHIHNGGDICHACLTTYIMNAVPVDLACYQTDCSKKIDATQLEGIVDPVLIRDFINRKKDVENMRQTNFRSSTGTFSSYANILLAKPNSQGNYNAYRSRRNQKEVELQKEENTLGTNANLKEKHRQKSRKLQDNLNRERNEIVKCFEVCPACLYIQNIRPSEFVCGYSYTHTCIKNKVSSTIKTLYPASFDEKKGLTYFCMVCGRPAFIDDEGNKYHYAEFNGKLEEQPKVPGTCGLVNEKLARLIQLQKSMGAQQAAKQNTNNVASINERAVEVNAASIDADRLKEADAILAKYPYLDECSNKTSALTQALQMTENAEKAACAKGAGAGAGAGEGGARKRPSKKTRKARTSKKSRKQTRRRR